MGVIWVYQTLNAKLDAARVGGFGTGRHRLDLQVFPSILYSSIISRSRWTASPSRALVSRLPSVAQIRYNNNKQTRFYLEKEKEHHIDLCFIFLWPIISRFTIISLHSSPLFREGRLLSFPSFFSLFPLPLLLGMRSPDINFTFNAVTKTYVGHHENRPTVYMLVPPGSVPLLLFVTTEWVFVWKDDSRSVSIREI